MVKFLSDFRKKIVSEYLEGGGGSRELAKKYSIGSPQTILDRVNRYKKYGDKAFNIRSSKGDYDGNFKMEVQEWMWSNRASLPETALHFDISTPSTIWSWEKKYKEKGVEALFNRRGRPKDMTTNHKHNQGKEESVELEKLQREIRMLRIENEI
ncbi:MULTISPECIES: helix-turn-helix domain-containing protein [Bacillaceae]|uniref:helix-turn-helix domain-containing protein n=1 Tax=Bacillaceae TaxID=186817 RepID=UPI002FFE24D6